MFPPFRLKTQISLAGETIKEAVLSSLQGGSALLALVSRLQTYDYILKLSIEKFVYKIFLCNPYDFNVSG
jgi:hypothetical protein